MKSPMPKANTSNVARKTLSIVFSKDFKRWAFHIQICHARITCFASGEIYELES
jgi:hypothetical protein